MPRSRWEWAQTGQLWLQVPGGQSWVGEGNHLDRDNRLGHWPLPMLTSSDQGGTTPYNLHLILLQDSINITLVIYHCVKLFSQFFMYFVFCKVYFLNCVKCISRHPSRAKKAPLTYLIYCDGLRQNQIKDENLLENEKRMEI